MTQPTGGAGMDDIDRFENLIGSPFADDLEGDEEANVVTGGSVGSTTSSTEEEDDLLLIRDGVADEAQCGDGDDMVTADMAGVDTFPNADCELFDFLPTPPQAPYAFPGGKAKKCKRKKKGTKRARPGRQAQEVQAQAAKK